LILHAYALDPRFTRELQAALAARSRSRLDDAFRELGIHSENERLEQAARDLQRSLGEAGVVRPTEGERLSRALRDGIREVALDRSRLERVSRDLFRTLRQQDLLGDSSPSAESRLQRGIEKSARFARAFRSEFRELDGDPVIVISEDDIRIVIQRTRD